MNILLISDVYFPRVNGVSTSIRSFAQAMQNQGHTVHLLAPDYGVETEDEDWITRIPAHTIYFDPEDRLMSYGKLLDLLSELRKRHFDIVHVHTPFVAHYAGKRLAHLLDVPVMETYHTFFEDYLHHYLPWIPKAPAKWLARTISKRQCNAVDAVISPSAPMHDVLVDYGVRKPIEVIATGLQAHSFADADGEMFRNEYGISLERPMVLYVGRVAFEKNIAFLLHMTLALRELHPNILFVIAGEGPALPSLKQKTQALGLQRNVQFIGYLDRETQLNACYKACDVFVFASKSETQGLVLLEAMAQSRPVVAIAELGTKSILLEGEGVLIAPEDEQVFAERVHTLLNDKKLAAHVASRGHAYVSQQWTIDAKATQMVKVYKRVINATKKYSLNKVSTMKEAN